MPRFAIPATVIATMLLCSCSSSPKPAGPRVDVSIGQQLIELKEAHDAGALTEREYKAQKKKLIDSVQ